MSRITQAFVLGAGLGLRLGPLTEQRPKPLVPIFHKPLITFALDHLRALGVESFVINTHRMAEQFDEAFADGTYAGAPVQLVNETVLLETGGGIKNVEQVLREEPFIVYSGDILTDIDLAPLVDSHFANGNDVTLALRETGLARGVALQTGRVIDIAGRFGHAGTHDFANVSIWNPTIFLRLPAATKISFIPVLLDWMSEGARVGGVVLNEKKWFNIGARDGYLEVHRAIAEENWRPAYVTDTVWPQFVSSEAQVEKSAQLSGFYAIGSGATVGAAAKLQDTIVWPGAQIASQSDLRNCIVRAHQTASGTLHDTDV
ncbi:MAG: sugar phosphate nucleotidyltransferase [Chthoniobacterales bacterium]